MKKYLQLTGKKADTSMVRTGKMLAPNWLFFMLPHEHIFSSMDALLAYLYDVSRCEDTAQLKRWFFSGVNMINIIAPINPLGYGVAGWNITKELSKITDIALWPIGNVHATSQEDADILQKAIANTQLFESEALCLKIWHQHDMAQFVGSGKRVGFPIFELDKFNDVEKTSLKYFRQNFCVF